MFSCRDVMRYYVDIEYNIRSIDLKHLTAHYDNESENYATPSISTSVHFLV